MPRIPLSVPFLTFGPCESAPWNRNPSNTDADHEAALLEIERLWDAKDGTIDGDRLEILMTMVEAYEETHFPRNKPGPNHCIISLCSSDISSKL